VGRHKRERGGGPDGENKGSPPPTALSTKEETLAERRGGFLSLGSLFICFHYDL
jgi:hypothetical protein